MHDRSASAPSPHCVGHSMDSRVDGQQTSLPAPRPGRSRQRPTQLISPGLDCGKRQRVDDVVHQGTAAEVVYRLGEALQHRADAHYVSAALDSFVRRVASVEIWKDEDIGASGHRAAGALALPIEAMTAAS
jgi:hypothetical protein